jgi:predicted glycosyltransferase
MLVQLLRFKPGLTMSLSSPYLVLLSRFLRISSITFDDTDYNPRLLPIIRLSKYLFSPASYPHQFHAGHFRLPVFKELAYLHPNYFQIKARDPQVFFRITRTDSIHHSRASLLDLDKLRVKISEVRLTHKVLLSSELPELEFDKNIQFANPTEIHNDLSRCSAFWGNSATMAAEAAVLGIPSVFVGAEKFAYITELEKYGLLFHFQPEQLDLSIEKLQHLLAGHPLPDYFMEMRNQLLSEKIDMTSFLIWFVENLPDSSVLMEKQTDYIQRFVSAKTL